MFTDKLVNYRQIGWMLTSLQTVLLLLSAYYLLLLSAYYLLEYVQACWPKSARVVANRQACDAKSEGE
jgi:hypothetical protein